MRATRMGTEAQIGVNSSAERHHHHPLARRAGQRAKHRLQHFVGLGAGLSPPLRGRAASGPGLAPVLFFGHETPPEMAAQRRGAALCMAYVYGGVQVQSFSSALIAAVCHRPFQRRAAPGAGDP